MAALQTVLKIFWGSLSVNYTVYSGYQYRHTSSNISEVQSGGQTNVSLAGLVMLA
jgi:hypothetical protein